MTATTQRYAAVSLWLETCGDDLTPRPPLRGDEAVDVAIVGGGFTGLWTAYALLRQEPSLRVLVLESEVCGFGASGRNGGWASDLFPVPWERLARRHGRDAALAMHRALVDGIDDIEATLRREDIDSDFGRSGSLRVARTPVQERAIRAEVRASQRLEPESLALRWLDAAESLARVAVTETRGASFTPHCARIHPGKLVRGLARAVERRGGRLAERTRVRAIEPGRAVTASGQVRAATVVRATEAFTPLLRGERRSLLPLYSLMIATEPLPEYVWSSVRWGGGETLADGRHLIIYAQRTADSRIAFGGRGAPYHFGSRVSGGFDRNAAVFEALTETLHQLLPATSGCRVTHRWGGPIGVARDWHPSVGLDRSTGIAWAGGYVGDGVTASNVAGRTIADLVLGRDSQLTRLPWVDHRSRRWEPEPLRWAGVNVGVHAMRSADAVEQRTGRRSVRAWAAARLQSQH